MRALIDILNEAKEEKSSKKEKEVFVNDDPQVAFPNDTVSALQKEINKQVKDLEKDWKNAIELVNVSFEELNVPIPTANLTDRWEQYNKLISYGVQTLYDARGPK